MKNRTYKVCFFVVLLIGMLSLGGCGRTIGEGIPELMEPVAANAAYRPVELGTIGETKILYGTVVPMEYCYFYDTSVAIKEIAVEIGDYVEKGDVIAYADTDMAKEQLENLNLQMENLNQNYEINQKISQLQILQIAESGAGEIQETNSKIAYENLYYDEILYEYHASNLQEEMKKQQKIIKEGTLKASHSGYVVYVKNMDMSTNAAAYENVVVLADPEETYIELADKTIDKYTYENYEEKYLFLAGKRYDVTEMSYNADVKVLSKASKKYPNVRLSCPDVKQLEIGTTYPIFYREKKAEEVPVIGLDSLKGEKDAYFVYVKTEDGEREKRSVTIGETDHYYAQIVSGLKTGEEVYYESEARMPANYTEYKVELSDYRIENMSYLYRLADEQVIWYDAKCEGTITEFAVNEGDEIQAGDLLYIMRSDAGKAKLAAAQNDINRENITYEERIKQINKSFSKETNENAQKILVLQKELETINHEYRLSQLEKTYNHMAEGNDGKGEIRVYAKQSGKVATVEARREETIAEGSHVLSVGNVAEDKLLVQMTDLKEERSYPKNIADFRENVTITVENEVYQGTCIGRTAHKDTNLYKYYVSTTGDNTVISYCTDSGYSKPAFYVEMNDENFYQDMPKGKLTFSYVEMKDVIVVPTAIVQSENNAKNPGRTDYFVWRVEKEELVKQYVLVNKEYSDVNTTVILAGVKEQDILAREKQ